MYLITAATDMELAHFTNAFGENKYIQTLVTGVGPVETAVRLTSWLGNSRNTVSSVINLGVAGAYKKDICETCANVLDICLAEREILGDFGIAFDDRIERFTDSSFPVTDIFALDAALLGLACRALLKEKIEFHSGTFVTVSSASGTARRGAIVGKKNRGLCENMEGAAVARVCKEFTLPCLEIRCISNMVENRDKSRWKLQQASERAGAVTALVMHFLLSCHDESSLKSETGQ